MIYKLIVNAAFLAFGYYLGKEIGRSEHIRKELEEPRESLSKAAEEEPPKDIDIKSKG